MIVMKFGGTSLRDAARIRAVAKIIKSRIQQKPVIIASAHHGVTEKLIGLIHSPFGDAHLKTTRFSSIRDFHFKIIKDLGLTRGVISDLLDEINQFIGTVKSPPTLKQLDRVVSYGERLAVRILAAYFSRHGIHAKVLDAFDIGMTTDSHFGQAQPLSESYRLIAKNIKPVIRKGAVPVITGFIAKDKVGNITTLGRNGSDYTATIVGAALGVGEVQIWSDSDGVMTADPRIVSESRSLPDITFNEASELAYYSRRFHPLTLLPAIHKNIPVRILNTYKPDAPGTVITKRAVRHRKPAVQSIVYKKDIFLVTITSPRMLMHYGFMEKIFDVFARHKIVIDMIATSEISVSVTTDRRIHLTDALKEIAGFAQVKVVDRQALICVIGEDIKRMPGLSGDIFGTLKLAEVDIKMISQGAARTNIAFIVDNRDVKKTVRVLHKTLFIV